MRQTSHQAAELFYPPALITDLPVQDEGLLFDSQGDHGITSIAVLPKAYGWYLPDDEGLRAGGGLAVAYSRRSSDYFGGTTARVGIHNKFGVNDPIKINFLEVDWMDQSDLGLSVGSGAFGTDTAIGLLGAQRLGEYVYVYIYYTAGTGSAEGATMYRFNYDNFAEIIYSRQFYLGGSINGNNSPIVTSFLPNAAIHVRDTYPPVLWVLNGKTTFCVEDNGDDFGQKYSILDPDLGPPTFYVRGRWAQTYGWNDIDPRVDSRDVTLSGLPTLVFPWSSGNYGTPELWWGVIERDPLGIPTQRMKIYRSKYLPDQQGSTSKETGNDVALKLITEDYDDDEPFKGYGFDPNWAEESKLVSIVGPFEGNAFSDYQNHATPPGLVVHARINMRVFRDSKTKKKLHMVFYNQGDSEFFGWNGSWHCVSYDDGATWGFAHRTSLTYAHRKYGNIYDGDRYIPGDYTYNFHQQDYSQNFVSVDSGLVIGNVKTEVTNNAHNSGGAANSLYIANLFSIGTADDPDNKPVVYKRGGSRISWV